MTTEVDGSSSGDPPSECGDGDVNIGEQCDDGNDDDTDACSNDCVASCGVLWNENMPADFIASSMAIDSAGNVVVLGAQIDATMTMASPASRTYDADGAFVGDVVSGVQWLASEGYAVLDADDNTFAFVNAQETAEAMPSLRLYKFDAAQAELFDVPVPAAVFDSSAGEPGLEVDVSPEGDAVLVAGIEIADGDDDIWVAKYSGVDGSELWATTHSGPLQGGFSTDQGGRVAVADDGTIYVAARIRNTFDQQPVVVLRFAPDGGPAEIEEVVFGDPGANNEQFPVQIATNGTQTAVGVNVFGGGTLDSRAAVGLLEGDAVAWTVLASDDLEKTKKISIGYARPAVAIDGDGNVLVAHSEEIDPDPTDGFIDVEVVVARYDSMGAIQCNHRWAILDSFRRPLSAEVLDDGTMVAFGTGGGGDWIARFRR
jgi:cysteine-rich repeat protein